MEPTSFAGSEGTVVVHRSAAPDPRIVVLLAHGYGEHAGRYAHVIDRLVGLGAAVYAPDHLGHGRSDGPRALIGDFEHLVDDLAAVDEQARAAHPGLPVVLIGHSLGGLLATRYAQRGTPLAALVLSGPFVGGNPDIEALMQLDPIPDVPIDPAVLSRDPAVGEAYASDPLVYHGPFQRATLEAVIAAVGAAVEGPGFGDLPTLWIHGELDALAPLDLVRATLEKLRGSAFEEHVYPGAQHEVFNEINRSEVLDDVTAFLERVLAPSLA